MLALGRYWPEGPMKAVTKTKFSKYLPGACAVLVLLSGAAQPASADAIPYPNSGTPNTISYTFNATTTGDVVAYFIAGAGASFSNMLGMLDNGVLTSSGFGLDNHTSAVGQTFDLGAVTAGDTLTFVLDNATLGKMAYSDPSLNGSYDTDGSKGHDHVYATAYTATPPIASIPMGSYIGFEDQPFPGADFNYNDAAFVLTNVTTAIVSSPEPGTVTLVFFGMLLLGLGTSVKRKLLA
jgi:hypothetical protein